MVYYLQTVAVALVALAGVCLGRFLSRLRKPYWAIGYALPLTLVAAITWARLDGALVFVPPFSWLMARRSEYVLLSLACATLLTTALSKLSRVEEKIVVGVFMVSAVCYLSVWPHLQFAMRRNDLLAIKTTFDSDGICRQSTNYNCGPAAAVTALKMLGIRGEEGKIAAHAYTNPKWGTELDSLCFALSELYGEQGLVCEHRSFETISELDDDDAATIVEIKFAYLLDHYVTVLDVTDDKIILADPLDGKRTLSHAEFDRKWRHVGIVLKRSTTEI
ncbi:MAG: hypothetical protein HY801_14030 [Candidatus Lindowbacteria bacterium]|nr:hypothetical protein [Candidatus Lindowbacteria bacterium]